MYKRSKSQSSLTLTAQSLQILTTHICSRQSCLIQINHHSIGNCFGYGRKRNSTNFVLHYTRLLIVFTHNDADNNGIGQVRLLLGRTPTFSLSCWKLWPCSHKSPIAQSIRSVLLQHKLFLLARFIPPVFSIFILHMWKLEKMVVILVAQLKQEEKSQTMKSRGYVRISWTYPTTLVKC